MTVSPILTRIAITPEEWAAVRKLAIDCNWRTSELLAQFVRDALTAREGKK